MCTYKTHRQRRQRRADHPVRPFVLLGLALPVNGDPITTGEDLGRPVDEFEVSAR